MKVRIITSHNAYNAGASLQTYALVTYLKKRGQEVRVIDYRPATAGDPYSLTAVGQERYDRPLVRQLYLLAKLPGRLLRRMDGRKRRFEHFRNEHIPMTRTYTSLRELRQRPPEADLLLAGSDQIWNTCLPTGRDPAYYLTFGRRGTVRASYAASFAADHSDYRWVARQKTWIEGLDHVSVRESSGLTILRGLGVRDAKRVMDPVFFLDEEAWRCVMPPADRRRDAYLFVYSFENSPVLWKTAIGWARQNGWKICSFYPSRHADRILFGAGPQEFLRALADADGVISDSFHATAFSLIFRKPFLTFERRAHDNSRMYDLLELVGLTEHMRSETAAPEPPPDVDWDEIGGRLCAEISGSEAYLSMLLGEDAMTEGREEASRSQLHETSC